MYLTCLSLFNSQAATSLVYPINVSSCAFVSKNTVFTLSFNRILPKVFDSFRIPQAMSDNCFLVSRRECVGVSVPPSLCLCCGSWISSMSSSPLVLPVFRCFSRSAWTKQAVSLCGSADWLAPRVASKEDLRRWLFSGSKTTYFGHLSGVWSGDMGTLYLECMLVFRIASARVSVALRLIISFSSTTHPKTIFYRTHIFLSRLGLDPAFGDCGVVQLFYKTPRHDGMSLSINDINGVLLLVHRQFIPYE